MAGTNKNTLLIKVVHTNSQPTILGGPMNQFNDQVAIVTGGAEGLGFGIANRLATNGASVLIVDQNEELGSKSSKILKTYGVPSEFILGDVSEPSTAKAAIDRAIEAWGRIDILINNAGIGGTNGYIWELPIDEMDRVYQVNLRGVFIFISLVVPHMIKKNYGRIVNMASVAGKEGNPRMSPYSASKAAVIGLTKSVGKELANTGIRVNCITPAVVKTSLLKQFTDEQVQYMIDKIPMGRTAEIEEVSSLAAWLASPECSFSTGAVFDISGGRSTY
jgi:NAD(P)-dependent dehydrogenase (short-subunit alcohol dehydrogenase family)